MAKQGSIVTNNSSKDLILNVSPKSRFTESIKTIRTNLAFSEINKKMNVVLVTSPEPGDGKSFIAANLATAYSQEDKKVLLIDCDLRRGRQHEIFSVMNMTSAGYSNLILNYQDKVKVEIDDSETKSKKKSTTKKSTAFDFDYYIINTTIKNVDLIPNGPTPPNPLELLASENNEKVLKALRKMYDVIILDCPPILGISDTTVMTKYSDANILVISNKRTKSEIINRCVKVFQQANTNITGVIINKASVKGKGYYGYYSDKYYGDKYYGDEN